VVPSPCRECVAQIDCKFAAHHARCWKPEEVAQQAIDLLDACKEYHAQIGDYPAFEFRQMLDTSRDIDVSKYRPPDEVEWARGEQAMINGALQIANSRLRDQGTQRAAGHDELFAGLAKIERIRGTNRAAGGRDDAASDRRNEWPLARGRRWLNATMMCRRSNARDFIPAKQKLRVGYRNRTNIGGRLHHSSNAKGCRGLTR
jgi:hypothetical protein